MVDKINEQDSNIVDFTPSSERSLASPAPISRFDHPADGPSRRPVDRAAGRADRKPKRRRKDMPGLVDFGFHPPSEDDVLHLKIVGFSVLMAVGTMIAGFAIAGGLLKVF